MIANLGALAAQQIKSSNTNQTFGTNTTSAQPLTVRETKENQDGAMTEIIGIDRDDETKTCEMCYEDVKE